MRKLLVLALAVASVTIGLSVPAQAAERTTNVVVFSDGITIVAEGVPVSKVKAVKAKAAVEIAADVALVKAASTTDTTMRPAPDNPPSVGKATVHCGWVTCSVYLTQRQTSNLQYNIEVLGGGLTALGLACGLISLYTGPAAIFTAAGCGAVVAVYGGFMLKAIRQADATGGCLRIKYPIWAFYNDHSGYCHV